MAQLQLLSTAFTRRSFQTIALGFFLLVAYSMLPPPLKVFAVNNCGTCHDQMVSQLDLGYGYECEHGPEQDPDCPKKNPEAKCCELKPAGCTGAPKECSCYDCVHLRQNSGGCEPLIEKLTTWCGKDNAGTCKTKQIEPYKTVILRFKRCSLTGAGSCAPTQEYQLIQACGGIRNSFACKAPEGRCTPIGDDWEERQGMYSTACDNTP